MAAAFFLFSKSSKYWTPLDLGSIANDTHSQYVTSLAASDSIVLAGTDGAGVLVSTSDGLNWSESYNGLTLPVVYAVVINGSKFIAGGAGVYLSTDDGRTWIDSSGGPAEGMVTAVAVNGTDLFAATNFGEVFLSTNEGTSWTNIDQGVNNNGISSLALHGSNLYVGIAGGMTGGVMFTANNGKTWTVSNTGLPSTRIWSIAVSGSYLVVGTEGMGVWRRPLSEMVASVQSPKTKIPSAYSLYQNYPNPFNPSTSVSFDLPTRVLVSLRIFDVEGREVATIASGEFQPGSYSIRWNAAGMSSGVYFCRLQAGPYVNTKKLVFLK